MKKVSIIMFSLFVLFFTPIEVNADASEYDENSLTTWEVGEARLMTEAEISDLIDGGYISYTSTFETATYYTRRITLDVNPKYKPYITIYYETTDPGTTLMKKILNMTFMTAYNGITMSFNGTIYTNLESSIYLYIAVDGKFYNDGTTTKGWSAGIDFKKAILM